MTSDEQHYRRLGMIATKGQAFETMVGVVIAQSLGIKHDAGSILAGRLGVRGALDAIRDLAALPDYPLNVDEVRAWLKLAHEANGARNRAIHSPWIADDETGEVQQPLGRGLKLQARTSTDLEKDLAVIDRAIVATQRFVQMSGDTIL